jgi:hypothetical protein
MINKSLLSHHFGKLCALIAATLVLPALAFAGHDNGKGNDGQNNGRGDEDQHPGDPRISAVPEANAGIVLIPFVGAVLLFSARHLLRRRATE